jgi:hypothetical protein
MTDKSALNIDYAAIGVAAAAAEDQTQMKAGGGGFERPLPAAGKCVLRLQQYIEIGVQAPRNKTYKPQIEVMLRFELLTPKHMIELETENGTEKIPNFIDIRVPKGGRDSKYGRLFAALNCSGKYNHFAQMVGTGAWMAEVTHNESGTGDDKKTYANLDKNKAWTFAAPVVEDPISGSVQNIPVPELHGEPRVFLYENKGLTDEQYLATWDSLFIEGEHEAKGDKPAKSKNWIQELIIGSLKFGESRLKKLLEARGDATALDIDNVINEIDQATEEAEKPAEKAEEPKQEPAATADDIDPLLAAL